uniref:porin n=1 Tax=uncultured Roseovarius sp. TaxID=293344 RepID=UPI0025CB7A50
DGLNFRTDAEIDFAPSITLDNGLTFSALVELEGQSTAGNQIDHTFMTISGDTLGTIQIGNLNAVTYNNSFQTPGVGSIGIDSGTMSGFFPLVTAATISGGTGAIFPTAHPDFSGDSMKINYITPSFNGFTLGLSYTPSTVGGNSANSGPIDRNAANQTNDVWGVSADYNQSLGTVDLGLHAHYQQAELVGGGAIAALVPAGTSIDPSNWGVGVNVGFDAFTVGMNYAEVDGDIAGTAAGDSTHLTLGATYNTGVWTFGADYIMQDNKAVSTTTAGADVESTAYRIGASRDLGPGVAWDVFAIHYDGDDKGCAGAGCTDVEGQMIGTAITLNF